MTDDLLAAWLAVGVMVTLGAPMLAEGWIRGWLRWIRRRHVVRGTLSVPMLCTTRDPRPEHAHGEWVVTVHVDGERVQLVGPMLKVAGEMPMLHRALAELADAQREEQQL